MYKVLIVEDDPMVSMINEQYVNKNSQFTVVGTCRNGEETMEFLEKKGVDLIILDVYMPYMDGIETLKKIREKNLSVSVIMVTAANDSTTFEEAMRLGAVDYLVKPFVYDRFQQALEKFVMASNVLKGGKILNQSNIDQIMGGHRIEADMAPKGIQDKTKSMILECLAADGSWLTGEDIAARIGLSAVTVRRYLNYLVQSGDVTGRMNYETGGRPSMLYRIFRNMYTDS